ncbi:MAG: TraX family protein [Lachnospiraceae bacterium]
MNSKQTNPKTAFGISGNILKWIAILTMLIDHIGASIFRVYMLTHGSPAHIYSIYRILRNIGRISFPIFIFLLVEGFYYTRSRKRYALQMLLFSFLSEIPFDLALYCTPFYFQSQNVFWTLLLGLVAICLMDRLKQMRVAPSSLWIKYYMQALIFLAFALLAVFLKTDYGYVGVTAIVIMYLAREGFHLQKKKQQGLDSRGLRYDGLDSRGLRYATWNHIKIRLLHVVAFVLCSLSLLLSTKSEIYALFGVVPIFFYNGTRGRQMKYFFYLFYPLHLLLLYGIVRFMGLA